VTVRRSIDVMRLIPEGCFIGTSLILPDQERFLFGVRRPKWFRNKAILEITGIGGGMEDRDASVLEGVQREAMEEIGAKVRLVPSEETLVVQSREKHTWVRPVGEVKPAAAVFRGYRTPAHRPWHPSQQGEAALLVFRASLIEPPTPAGELPALIWLSGQQILDTALQDVPLSALISGGALTSAREPEALPGEATLRMTDSQEAIAIALGQATLGFYSQFAR
jgi:8-oxo-dGTP pyrophosphatase MutT (NUDIX family)